MSDLIAGCAVALLALAAVVLPAVLVARWQDRRRAGARHRLSRPHPAVVLARDLLGLLRTASAPATWGRIRAGMSRPPRYVDTSRTLEEIHAAEDGPRAKGYPRPTYYGRHDGAIIVGKRNEIEVRPVNGRNLGTLPRLDRQGPFTVVDMPAIPAPDEPGPAWGDPGDGLDPAPPVLGFARSLVYGEACVLDVAEAERLKGLMIP